MEICVMVGLNFFNEDSEIARYERIETEKYTEQNVELEREVNILKDGTQTTLKSMYADGWILKHVKPIRLTHGVLLFLER